MEGMNLNAERYAGWRKLHQDFVGSGMTAEDYCRAKGLQLNWFIRQGRKAATYEKRRINPAGDGEPEKSRWEKLFVELIPDAESSTPSAPVREPIVTGATAAAPLKLMFREVTFELMPGFPVETFRQALQVVQEVR